MAGVKSEECTEEDMRRVYIDNLRYASRKLAEHNITALIEPINSKISRPGYFLDRVDEGL